MGKQAPRSHLKLGRNVGETAHLSRTPGAGGTAATTGLEHGLAGPSLIF